MLLGCFFFLSQIELSVFVEEGEGKLLDPKIWKPYYYNGLFIDRFINHRDNREAFCRLVLFAAGELRYNTDGTKITKPAEEIPSDKLEK